MLALQIVLVLGVTLMLVASSSWLARRIFGEGVKGILLATTLRVSVTVLFCILLAVAARDKESAHRTALVFTAGAGYFAVVLLQGFLASMQGEGRCRSR